jgi:hypothetical protein
MVGLCTIALTSVAALADTIFTVNPQVVNIAYPKSFPAGLIDFSYNAEVDLHDTCAGCMPGANGVFQETGVVSFSSLRLFDPNHPDAGTSAINGSMSGLNNTPGYKLWAAFEATGTTEFHVQTVTSVGPNKNKTYGDIGFTVLTFDTKVFLDPSQDDCSTSSANLACQLVKGMPTGTAVIPGDKTAVGDESVKLFDPSKDDIMVAHTTAFIGGNGDAFFPITASAKTFTNKGSFDANTFGNPDAVAKGTGGLFFGWPTDGTTVVHLSGNNNSITLPTSKATGCLVSPSKDPLCFADGLLSGAGQVDVNFTVVPEPTALLLLGSGLFGLVIWQRFRKSQ